MPDAATSETRDWCSSGSSLERYLEHVPAAFAITQGVAHTLVYANAAFRRLTAAAGEAVPGHPVADSFAGRDASTLCSVLDDALRTGLVARDRRIDPVDVRVDAREPTWCCTVWPLGDGDGSSEHLVLELRVATEAELTLALQRDVAERMLLSALREQEVARGAEAARSRAAFLSTEGRRLAESLDENTTRESVARVSLPHHGAWCIVDVVGGDGAVRRLAIVHPDPVKQLLARELEGRWSPEPGDTFGMPAALRSAQPTVVADVDAALATATHHPEILRILRQLGIGPLLTVPLLVRGRLIGAVTFVSGQRDHVYTPEDVELAEELAARGAMSLESARVHGEAILLRTLSDVASQAKSAFLGTMSHELRTPLNAIGGYVDLLDMGLRGPVTEVQRADLARIRHNQRHLLGLITDVLNFVRVGSAVVPYDTTDVSMHEVLADSVALVEPLIGQQQIVYGGIACDATIVARADREKVTQVMVNLLSNAIKFTPAGQRLDIGCEVTEHAVLVHVADTGMGIPANKLEAIFDPFVQVRTGLAGRDSGVGLGLAISRNLARGMGGDLRVRSVVGEGSTFTLSLPLVDAASGVHQGASI